MNDKTNAILSFIIDKIGLYLSCTKDKIANDITVEPAWYFKNRTEIVRSFSDYFYFGGLPELELIEEIEKRQWLSNLFNKIFFGDLITRYSIRNDLAMKVLIRKLAESVKQPSSFNRLSNIVSSTGVKVTTDTVIDYLEFFASNMVDLFY